MNIFYLSKDPKEAAVLQYNKHVVKMVLETAQLLCTAHHILGEENNYDTWYVPYKSTHKNHPSAIWVRSSDKAYRWAYNHMLELGEEYTKRYNKVHLTITKCKDILKDLPKGIPLLRVWEDPPQCMPDKYKDTNAVIAYWNYYLGEKHSVCNSTEKQYSGIPYQVKKQLNI
jgi:hypothetical protein